MTWSKSSFGFCFFKILPNLRLHLLVTQLPVSNFNSLNETPLPKDQFWFYGFHIERGRLTNNSITLKSFNSPYATSSRRKLIILLECKLCNSIAGEQLWKRERPHFQPALLQPWLIFTLCMFTIVSTFAEEKEEGSSSFLPSSDAQRATTKGYVKEHTGNFHIQRISGSTSNPFKLESLCKQDHRYATAK